MAEWVEPYRDVRGRRRGRAHGDAVRGRLDGLASRGVVALHDRRVPARRVGLGHVVVSPGGVFVVVATGRLGRVTATSTGLRVGGRPAEHLLIDVQVQVVAVQHLLRECGRTDVPVHGVLCFTRARLPWRRPAPGGVLLTRPRGLRRTLCPGAAPLDGRVPSVARALGALLPPA